MRKIIRTLQRGLAQFISAKEFYSRLDQKGKAGGSQEMTGVSRRMFLPRGDSSIPGGFRAPYSVLRTSVCLTGQAGLTTLWSGDSLGEPSSPPGVAQGNHTGLFLQILHSSALTKCHLRWAIVLRA